MVQPIMDWYCPNGCKEDHKQHLTILNICPICGTKTKSLFGTKRFCPNNCDQQLPEISIQPAPTIAAPYFDEYFRIVPPDQVITTKTS